jgi:hypothetical protein
MSDPRTGEPGVVETQLPGRNDGDDDDEIRAMSSGGPTPAAVFADPAALPPSSSLPPSRPLSAAATATGGRPEPAKVRNEPFPPAGRAGGVATSVTENPLQQPRAAPLSPVLMPSAPPLQAHPHAPPHFGVETVRVRTVSGSRPLDPPESDARAPRFILEEKLQRGRDANELLRLAAAESAAAMAGGGGGGDPTDVAVPGGGFMVAGTVGAVPAAGAAATTATTGAGSRSQSPHNPLHQHFPVEVTVPGSSGTAAAAMLHRSTSQPSTPATLRGASCSESVFSEHGHVLRADSVDAPGGGFGARQTSANAEYFVRTEHSTAFPSVKFDSQQEMIAAVFVPPPAAARHGGGAGRHHSRTNSPSVVLPAVAAGAAAASTAELDAAQRAAIAAFSGDHGGGGEHGTAHSRPPSSSTTLLYHRMRVTADSAAPSATASQVLPPASAHAAPAPAPPTVAAAASANASQSNLGSPQPPPHRRCLTAHPEELTPNALSSTMLPGGGAGDAAAGGQTPRRNPPPALPSATASSGDGTATAVYTGFGPRPFLVTDKEVPFDTQWQQHTLPSMRFECGFFATSLALLIVAVACVPIGSAMMQQANDVATRLDVRYDLVSLYHHPPPVPVASAGGSRTSLVNASSGGFAADPFYIWSFDLAGARHRQGVKTVVRFNVTRRLRAPVMLSYRVTNFFMNHLAMASSRSVVQNSGNRVQSDLDVANCNPLLTPGDLKSTDAEKAATGNTPVDIDGRAAAQRYARFAYLPCGTLAWSRFNDSFVLWRVGDSQAVADPAAFTYSSFERAVPAVANAAFRLLNVSASNATASALLFRPGMPGTTGATLICNTSDFTADGSRLSLSAAANPCDKAPIQSSSDREKFFDPNFVNNNGLLWTNTVHRRWNTSDPYLSRGWYVDEPGHEVPSLQDRDYQIWTRVAPLADIRKILRVVNVDLAPGQYQLEVDEYWDAAAFGGQKLLSLETRSPLGGESLVLPSLYIGVGGIALVLFLLTVLERMFNGDDDDDDAW